MKYLSSSGAIIRDGDRKLGFCTLGKVQNMDPWSMDPLRGAGPWNPLSWTASVDPLFLQVEVAP